MRYSLAQILFGLMLVLLAWFFPNSTMRGRACGVWRAAPVLLKRILRRGRGDVSFSSMAGEAWGLLAIASGLIVLLGVVQPERAAVATLLVANLVGAGLVALTLVAIVLCDRRRS